MEKTANADGADVRIVNVSSAAVMGLPDTIRFRNREDFNDEHLNQYLPSIMRTGRSKLANILFTKELQRHFDEQKIPIICLSLNPGTVNTEGTQGVVQRQGWLLRTFATHIFNCVLPTPDQGAYTQVFASVAPLVREQADKYKGVFLMPPAKITSPSKPAESEELAKELWETTEALLKEMGVEL